MTKFNKKVLVFSILIFIVGFILAFYFDEYYRIFIRNGFKIFNGKHIEFVGKNFHFFSSDIFAIVFGLFFMACFLLTRNSKNKIRIVIIVVFVFILSNAIICFIESKYWVLECTGCKDGIRQISYNELSYDYYLLISTIMTLICVLLIRKLKKYIDK